MTLSNIDRVDKRSAQAYYDVHMQININSIQSWIYFLESNEWNNSLSYSALTSFSSSILLSCISYFSRPTFLDFLPRTVEFFIYQ